MSGPANLLANFGAVVRGFGVSIQPTDPSHWVVMQLSTEDVSLVNNDRTPEGEVPANPGSLCFDRVAGELYLKSSGYAETGWVQLTAGGGPMVDFVTDSGTAVTAVGVINMLGSGSITTTGAGNTVTIELTGLTNHNVLVGAGTTTITKVAPSATSGIPLISQGAAADPTYGTAVVAGGGTGAVTLTGIVVGSGTSALTTTTTTIHNVLLGAASNAITNLVPSVTSGIALVSQGAVADPAFSTVVVAGGGTGAVTLTGVLTGNGTSAVTANAATQYNVIIGGASNAIANVAPSATSGVPLISQGAAADPVFGTAVVAGGGTGATSLTGILTGNGTSAFTASTVTTNQVLIGAASNAVTNVASGVTGQVLSAVTGGAPIWAAPAAQTVVGNATAFFLDATASLADNLTLSTSPSAYAEIINSVATTAATSPVFFERFVSGALGRTSIPAGAWTFYTYAAINNISGTNVVNFRINKRVAQTGMTGTFTGAGPTRTFTVTGGTPFVPGDANASRLLAGLIETPTQTAWISAYTSSSEVTVTLTDPAFVNVSGVTLSAIYYFLFNDSTISMTSTSVTLYTTVSVQPSFTGLGVTDRLVIAYFATSATNKSAFDLYYGGTQHFTYFTSPLVTLTHLTGNSGGPLDPDVNSNFNILGTGSTTVAGSGSTLTVQLTSLTNHNVLVGAGTATITNVAPSATAGVPLISQGAAVDPAFGTVVVAGGGTGAVTLTGIVVGTGTSALTTTTTTTYNVLVGAASNAIANVAPHATSGVPLISQGAAANPAFGTAVVAGGGTGAVTLTGVLIGNGTSAVTGNAVTQYNALVGGASNAITSKAPTATVGVPFISQGAAADPVFGTAVVAGGGTGAVTLTGVLTGNGTSAITANAATQYNVIIGGVSNAIANVAPGATAGVPLISQGAAANPVFGTVLVAGGGSGAVTLTGILTGNGTSAFTASTVTQGGVLLAGATNSVTDTGVLAKGTIIVGDGVTAPTLLSVGTDTFVLTADAVAASGVKWAAATGSTMTWTVVTAATQTCAVNNGYIGNRATSITFTLPAVAAVGDIIRITNFGAGLPIIAVAAGQNMQFTASTSTVTTGTLTAVERYDTIDFICVVANTNWNVLNSTGNWTIT